MANPAPVTCTINAWTKVADSVENCIVHKHDYTPVYYQTYRVAGDTAPSGAPTTPDAIEWGSASLVVTFSYAVDVYIYANGAAGSVRVDT